MRPFSEVDGKISRFVIPETYVTDYLMTFRVAGLSDDGNLRPIGMEIWNPKVDLRILRFPEVEMLVPLEKSCCFKKLRNFLQFALLFFLPTLKFNSSPWKVIYLPKRKIVFQPSFFRGYIKLRRCSPYHLWRELLPTVYCQGSHYPSRRADDVGRSGSSYQGGNRGGMNDGNP